MTAAAALHVGVLLPSRQPGTVSNPAAAVVNAAKAAEVAGFDSVWVGDSLIARPRLDPLTALAGVAVATTRVRIGSAVLLGALRPAVPVAHALTTIDLLSGGRLIVGVGAGAAVPATEDDFRAASAAYEGRVARMYDTVRVWRAVWAGDPAPSTRAFPELEGVRLEPLPARPGGPPVWLAGEGPQTLRQAGRSFDGWLPFSATPESFASAATSVRAAAVAAGRPVPVLGAYLTVTVHDDPELARVEQAAFVESYYGVPFDFMRAVQGYASGTAEQVAAWLRVYVDEGASHLVLRLAGADFLDDLERAGQLVELLRRGALSL